MLALFTMPSVVNAGIICPVDVDTYLVPMGECGYGYPVYDVVKSMEDWMNIPALIRFDLTPLDGLSGSLVGSAKFKFYRLDSPGGFMSPPTAPAGEEITATIHALDDSVLLTEELLPGDPYHGVIDRCNRPNIFGDAYPVSNDTGPNTWAEADITGIVKDWLNNEYLNNGIEFLDNSDPNEYVWYWTSIQGNEEYRPYLDVSVVPEPTSLVLLTTGLLGLFGMGRTRRRFLKK